MTTSPLVNAGCIESLTLEEDQLFVMGDNREASMDSRTFGAVGKRQIKGKILLQGGNFYIRKTFPGINQPPIFQTVIFPENPSITFSAPSVSGQQEIL